MLDEYLEVFDRACRGGTVAFHGAHADFDPVALYPTSRQQPRFPMIGCGTRARALKRGARYDGLFRILTGVDEIAPVRAQMGSEAQRVGNDTQVGNDAQGLELYDYQPMMLTEGAAFEGVGEYERAGMDQLVHGFTADPFGPMPAQLENMEQFAIEVMRPYRS